MVPLINKIKYKNYNISIIAENAFDQKQHPFKFSKNWVYVECTET